MKYKSIRVDAETHAKIAQMAKENIRSMNGQVKWLVDNEVVRVPVIGKIGCPK